MSNELSALIERVKRKTYTDRDIKILEAFVNQSVSQNTSQRGNNNFNANDLNANSVDIHIGDRNGITLEEIQAIVKEVTKLSDMGKVTASADEIGAREGSVPLTILSIEPALLNYLNSQLTTLDEVRKSGCLSEPQRVKFNSIKNKVSYIEEKNQELKLISYSIEQILTESTKSLSEKLRELKASQDDSLYNARAQICTQQNIKILEEFQEELRDGKVVSRWISQKKDELTDSMVRHVLDMHPNIESTASARRLKLFRISIGQFIERLCNCLELGSSSSLEEPETPVALEKESYIEAFEQLKKEIPGHMPSGGRSQLAEYIEYLTENLGNYKYENVE